MRMRRVRTKELKRYLVTFLRDDAPESGDEVVTDTRYVNCDYIDRSQDDLVRFIERENPDDEPVTRLAIPRERFLRAEIQPAI